MALTFPLTVLYTQIVVFRADLAQPGLSWDDDHVAQGFAWRDGTVAFGVPDHDGQCLIDVDTASEPMPVVADALWSIAVPFVAASPDLQIGAIMIEHPYPITPGTYQLTFDALPGQTLDGQDYAFRCLIRFAPTPDPVFAIRRQGEFLQTGEILRRDAEIA